MGRNESARPEGFLNGSPSCTKISPVIQRRLKVVYNAINEVVGLWTPLPSTISAGLNKRVIAQVRAWGYKDISEAELFTAVKIVKGIDEYLVADSVIKIRLRKQAVGILADILSAFETDGIEHWDDLVSSVQESTREVHTKAYAAYEISIWLNSLYEQLVTKEQESARKDRQYEDVQHKVSVQSETISSLQEKLATTTTRLAASETDVTRLSEENQALRREIEAKHNLQALNRQISELETHIQEQQRQLERSALLAEEYQTAQAHLRSLKVENQILREEGAEIKRREEACRRELLALYATIGASDEKAKSLSTIVSSDGAVRDKSNDVVIDDLPTKTNDGKEIIYNRRHFVKRVVNFDSIPQAYILAAMRLFAEDPFCLQLATERIHQERLRVSADDRVFRSYIPGLDHYRFLWRMQEDRILVFRLYKKGTKEDTKRTLASYF